MATIHSKSVSEIGALLDEWLEVEYSFIRTEEAARSLADLSPQDQGFILTWVQRVASTNIGLGHRFARQAHEATQRMSSEMIEGWCLHAMDCYDRFGLAKAIAVISDLEGFLELGHRWASGALYEEALPVLFPFLQGLSGRRLKIEQGRYPWTDGEYIYLPEFVARFDDQQTNFQLLKSMVALLWAQTRFGTLNINLAKQLSVYPDPQRAQTLFHALETIRLEACIERELPGLHRTMRALRSRLDGETRPENWGPAIDALSRPDAAIHQTLEWLKIHYRDTPPPPLCYQGRLDPETAWAARQQRLLREKARFRESLRLMVDELCEEKPELDPEILRFEVRYSKDESSPEGSHPELALADKPLFISEQVRDLLSSIVQDLTEIPEEYLVPAGPGEYDPSLLQDQTLDPDQVWSGTYHEEGAFFYNEWDCGRQSHRKNWCVLREHDIQPGDTGFYRETLKKYGGFVHSLRRTFEILRGEDRLLRRQRFGEDVDLDALIEALADVQSGREMTDRLFTRMHKEERNIAVVFMVDMSGSTRGWINDAERESLILLAESLELLGDRYAIYGFSGWSRKRCEVFRIKAFDDPLDDSAKGRICGIEAKDYTRMGAPIRHFTHKLKEVEARTKLLITLSDGKPDDYDLEYRGEYGIEDTRQALFEARRDGIHPFCITIDKEGQEYLPHMYGAANYTVIEDVRKLPLKVSDIYRRITT
jgi:nitric oxide reductase NorD protein